MVFLHHSSTSPCSYTELHIHIIHPTITASHFRIFAVMPSTPGAFPTSNSTALYISCLSTSPYGYSHLTLLCSPILITPGFPLILSFITDSHSLFQHSTSQLHPPTFIHILKQKHSCFITKTLKAMSQTPPNISLQLCLSSLSHSYRYIHTPTYTSQCPLQYLSSTHFLAHTLHAHL